MTLRRISKWTMAGVAVFFFPLLLLSHCVSFGVKPEQTQAFFTSRSLTPRYLSYKSGDRKIHYVDVGEEERPMVLFVHGSPGDWTAFLDYLGNGALLKRARLIAVDRPGFGLSDKGRAEKSMARQASDLRHILEQNRSGKPAILVGHSLGGPVIARMAMDYPELVGGIILVAPSIDPELEKTKWFQIPANWMAFSWMVPTDLVTSNREILPLKGQLQEMLPLWAKITAPSTVIQGEQDRLVPPENADFAKKMLVNSPLTMVRIQDMNHFVPWTRPDLIEDAVLRHLDLLQEDRVLSSQ